MRPSFFYLYLCVSMYLFRRKDPNRPTNTNIKIMHIINTIAIVMFVGGILWKLIDWLFLS
jgi:hypothetical protein